MKALARDNPTLVRLVHAPAPVARGARDLASRSPRTSTRDGRRPAGVRGLRDAPRARVAGERGDDRVRRSSSIKGYKAGHPRLPRSCSTPGRSCSRFSTSTASTPRSRPRGSTPAAPTRIRSTPAARRATRARHRRVQAQDLPRAPCGDNAAEAPCIARTYPRRRVHDDRGVDPNRNYGVLWGGPGSGGIVDLTFHGTGPVLRARDRGFRRFLRDLQPRCDRQPHVQRPDPAAARDARPGGEARRAADARAGRHDGGRDRTTFAVRLPALRHDGTTDDYSTERSAFATRRRSARPSSIRPT